MTWDPWTMQGKKVLSAPHISFGLFCREFKTAYSETSRDRKWDESMFINKSSPIRLLWYSIKEILHSYRMNRNQITFLIRRMEWMDLSGNAP